MKINFLKASASRLGVWSMCAAVALFTAVSFTSCSSDDDGGGNGGDEGGLVDSSLPTEGWSGSVQNGILTYLPDETAPSYYAFDIENGVCTNAVYNYVCESEAEAKYMYTVLKDGTWASMGDDEEYAYDAKSLNSTLASASSVNSVPSISASKVFDAAKKISKATRAESFVAKYNVSRNGRVLYVTIDCLKGKTVSQLTYAVNAWSNGGFVDEAPTSFLFGTWDEATNTYKCTNLYGIGATYEVKMDVTDGYVKKYVTTLTMPSEAWAVMIEMALEETLGDYEQMFGATPTLTRDGNKVSMDALIIGDVPVDFVMKSLYVIDYMNNVPFLSSMVG